MVLQYFRCNGWLSLSHVIPVSRLRVDPKSGVSVTFLSIKPDGYVTVWHMKGRQMPSQTLPFWHRYSSRGLKYFSSNGWFSLYHITPFARLRVPPKSGEFWWYFLEDMAQCNTFQTDRCLPKLFTYHIYTSKVLQYFRCNGWLSLSPVIPVSRLIVDPKSGDSVLFCL